jgi:GGDEF domain-containing protein/CHASE3 domain sensor protein
MGSPALEKLSYRPGIIQKIIFGYAIIILFSLVSLITALVGLNTVNRIVTDIAHQDFTALESIHSLRSILVTAERNAARSTLMKGPEFATIYRQHNEEFQQVMLQLRNRSDQKLLQELAAKHAIFSRHADLLVSGQESDTASLRRSSVQLHELLDHLTDKQAVSLKTRMQEASRHEQSTVTLTLILSFSGFLMAIAVAAYTTYSISASIRKLRAGTMRIARGEFDCALNIPPGDEIGDLAADFSRMGTRLKELEQISLDASPLTRLPGNIAIERILTRKLETDEPFAVCYADLDNFKAYTDRYGYIQASELIKRSGQIIDEAATALGGVGPFVGHVGGDDFVMIVDADTAGSLCERVIDVFDREVPSFYSEEDRERGGIDGIDRYGVPRWFPLMSISIAVIICRRGEYDSAVDIAQAAAHIKNHVKDRPGSSYLVNRRRHNR